MSSKDIRLYKFITKEEYECGWVDIDKFYVWVRLHEIKHFVDTIKSIFGENLFDDGGHGVQLLENYICVDICDLLYSADIEIEEVFPKDEFMH